MTRIYVGYGSVNEAPKGGLERVTKSHLLVKNDPYSFYSKFVLLGSERSSGDFYEEFPWRGVSLVYKVYSLMLALMYVTRQNDGCSVFYMHGSPIVYLLGVFNRTETVIYHHGDVVAEKLVGMRFFSFRIALLYFIMFFCDYYFIKHVSYNYDIISRITRRGKHVKVIPNFVEDKFDCTDEPQHDSVVFTMAAYWNVRKDLRAAVDVLKKVSFVRLNIIGPVCKDYLDEYNACMDDLSSMSNVQLDVVGEVSDDELVSILNQTDYLLHMAHREGFPRVFQEAQICGCMIVCYVDFFNPDLLGDSAVDVSDIEFIGKTDFFERQLRGNEFKDLYSLKSYSRSMMDV